MSENAFSRPCWGGPCTAKGIATPGFCTCKIDAENLELARSENERLRTSLGEIDAWSRAYPLKVFPEPDFKKASEVLKAAGMTLDAISASNMRHVVEGVGKIARSAVSPD